MPHKSIDKLGLKFPAWVDQIDDACLLETLKQALVARFSAINAGAFDRQDSREIMKAADTTMEQIQYRRVLGQIACRKAATALRKYALATERAEGHAHGRYGGKNVPR